MESTEAVSSKYFLNEKTEIIKETLEGLCMTNNNLVYYPEYNFLYDSSQLVDEDRVKLICGGGSGHEPAHAGFVTDGILTCAVCGDIFSSPSFLNIVKAIEKIYSNAGVIMIVKNYTGDIINFSLAKEMLISAGKKVDILIVDDDISLANLNVVDTSTFNKRRGLCGTVLVYKILGELCRRKYKFEDIFEYGKSIIPALYTVGVSLSTCVLPFSKIDSENELKSDEFEVGLGIHGEKGKERVQLMPVNEIIDLVFRKVMKVNMKKEIFEKEKDIALVVNNLGSLTQIEMNVIMNSIMKYFSSNEEINHMKIKRIIHGSLMTSLDMKGFSITIFNLNENEFMTGKELEILSLLDQNVTSHHWNIFNPENFTKERQVIIENIYKPEKVINDPSQVKVIVKQLFEYLKTKANMLNELDKQVGDGDIGYGVEKAAGCIVELLDYLNFEHQLKSSMKLIGEKVGTAFGGTSGPLYASLILKGADRLPEFEKDCAQDNWIDALIDGTKMIQSIGKANVGDRTMLDLLFPVCEAFDQNRSSNASVLKEIICDSVIRTNLEIIRNLKSKRGRSAYLNGKEVGFDDPGCVLVSLWLEFIFGKIK